MTDTPRAARFLEGALVLTFVTHLAAMATMALVLAPFIPGGSAIGDAERMRMVALHPWLFRLGWFPWQLTAASDLVLALALVRTPWIARWPAWLGFAATACAVVPDQAGQLLWMLRGPEIAASRNLPAYLEFESTVFRLTAVWGALGYTIAACFWSGSFASARTWARGLTVLSVAAWALFLSLSLAPLLPDEIRPADRWIAAGNAVGFILLIAWTAWVTELVFRRARPDTAWGGRAPWRSPGARWTACPLEWAANSRFAKALCGLLPLFRFRSDITDVIYANWLVPADRLLPLVPEGLELARVGPDRSLAILTVLTFRHGHFGPALAGPFRRLFPSPIQSNWRVYVRDPRTGLVGIAFFTQGISNLLNGLGARLMARGMPMHRFAGATLERATDGKVVVRLEPGGGSAPDLVIAASPASRELPAVWNDAFDGHEAAVQAIVPIERAYSSEPEHRSTTRQEIGLGIKATECEPLQGEARSACLHPFVGDAPALLFRVARVDFRFAAEIREPWDAPPWPGGFPPND